MAAGSFTLTRRNNKSDYVILRTMQRATVRYENIDCLCLTCDTVLLLFDMNISATFAGYYYFVWKYRLTLSTYDAALLLFGMKISTTLGTHVKCGVLLFGIQYVISVRTVRFPYLDTWKAFTECRQARIADTICAPPVFFVFALSVIPQVSRYGNCSVRCSVLLFVMKISTVCSLHKIQHCYYSS